MKAAVRTSADDNSSEAKRRAEALGFGKCSCKSPESVSFSLGNKVSGHCLWKIVYLEMGSFRKRIAGWKEIDDSTLAEYMFG